MALLMLASLRPLVALRPSTVSSSLRARPRTLSCNASADTSLEIPEEVEIVKPKRFMDALRENAAKKTVRNWESVEIAKAMNVAEGGMAPELIQGRLAMLGWLGVIFAEKVTGQPAIEQYVGNATLINWVVLLISLATLMPTLVTANALADIVAATKTGMPEKFKDINGQVEETVGRAAMVGMLALVLVEAGSGAALFL